MAATNNISGFNLTPSVSSSKNLKSPALAAGMGADSLFFFLLITDAFLYSSAFKHAVTSIIYVVLSSK